MKKLILIGVIMVVILSSCCKGAWEIAVIEVSYPSITASSTLKAIRTERNNLNAIVDTIFLGKLTLQNSFSALIEFDDNPFNYIIYIDSTIYMDTISDMTYDREGCSDDIENFQYKFNGFHSTSKFQIITE